MSGDFRFAEHAEDFDGHIRRSIPGLDVLRGMAVDLSRTFVQPQTNVLDVGCSTGAVLSSIRDANEKARAGVRYVGIDAEGTFRKSWAKHIAPDIRFDVKDARSYDGFRNLSLVTSLFTMQFVPEGDRLALLRRIHDGLLEGGGLIIAEKVLANTARFQDLFLGPYYDFKRQSFSETEILDKERALRAGMHLWSEPELSDALVAAGFDRIRIHRFWQSYLFVGFIAVKRLALTQKRSADLSRQAA
jgi:tRNA (cmo5U34)-methyltransferase